MGVVRNPPFIRAAMPHDHRLRNAHRDLLAVERPPVFLHPLENAIEVVEVLPHEPADSWILWDGFKRPVWEFITGGRSFDWDIVYERNCYVGDLLVQDV